MAYFRTRPTPEGRWLVVHTVPGTTVEHADEDCPTLVAAEKAAAWLEAERAMSAPWLLPDVNRNASRAHRATK